MFLRRIAHVNLSIDDVNAARAFYGGVLGLSPAPRPAEVGRPGCWYTLGDVELHLSVEEGIDNARSRRHVAFEVIDMAAARGRFEAAGVAMDAASPMEGIDRFFVRDPAGNRLEFYARIEGR